MTKLEVRITNGDIFKINFEGTLYDFEEKVRYDNGTFFVIADGGWRILIKDITAFRTTEGNN